MTDQPGEQNQEMAKPPQFTLRSLVTLTFLLALFFALATQIPFIYAAGYFHLFLLMFAPCYPTKTKGIMAINYAIFNGYLLPAIVSVIIRGREAFAACLLLVPTSILISLVLSIVLLLSGKYFNKIAGCVSIVINVLVTGVYLFLLFFI